jgi:hypothetical protein
MSALVLLVLAIAELDRIRSARRAPRTATAPAAVQA